MVEREVLMKAIAAQEALRGELPDEVVDAAIDAIKSRLDAAGRMGAGERRRQATVLFADVAGFTAMSSEMDAERVATLMNELWAGVDEAIRSNGGHVDKHIGDAVLGVWGTEITREDDPERAIRSALDLLSAFALFKSTHGLDIDVRIGVNTGPVHFGAIGTSGERSVTGDAVNVASRVEHAAPSGGVLITHDTYRHVRGVFDVQERSPIQVKGKTVPLLTYEVEGAKERSFRFVSRGVEGVDTQLIGRAAEFAALQQLYHETERSGRARIVGLVGEAGAGKSRLLYEFANWLDLRPEPINYFKGRAVPESQAVPLGLLRELFAYRLDIRRDDGKQAVAAKLARGLKGLTPQEAEAAGHWLGFDLSGRPAVENLLGSDQFGRVASAHLVRSIGGITADAPTVMLLEDLHWADDDSLEAVNQLLATLSNAPLFIVWASRPEFLLGHPEWSDHPRHRPTFNLEPLSSEEGRALVNEILQRAHSVPDELIDLVQRQADGNPLYIEELIKVMIEQGVISVQEDSDWQVDDSKLSQVEVPPTLTAVLQSRLDVLEPAERVALQRASIVGRTFWDDAVAHLLSSEEERADAAIAPKLETALEHELIRTRLPSTFRGCTEFVFKHALLRDVAYQTVLLRERERLHERAAIWLEQRAGDRIDEYLGPIADHFEQAHRYETAATYVQRLADRARDAGARQQAAAAYRRSLDLRDVAASDDSVEATRARIELGEIFADFRQSDDALAVLDRAEQDARRIRDLTLLARALTAKLWTCVVLGFWSDAAEAANEARPLVRTVDKAELARFLLAESVMYSGGRKPDVERAQASAVEALELSRSLEVPTMEIRAINNIAFNLTDAGHLDEADEWRRQALGIAQRIGDEFSQLLLEGNLAATSHLRARQGDGDYVDVIASYEAIVERAPRLGLRGQLPTINLAQAQIEADQLGDAARNIGSALREAWEAGIPDEWRLALVVWGQHRIASGKPDQGLEVFGAVLADEDAAKLRNEVAGILDFYGIEAKTADSGMAIGKKTSTADLVQRLLSNEGAKIDSTGGTAAEHRPD